MTDEELIARLRDEHVSASRFEAADRIEQLVKERDEATNQLDSARHSVDVLEKRVEALVKYRNAYAEMDRIATDALRKSEARVERLEAALREIEADCEADYPPSHGAIKQAIRTALKGCDHA